MKVPATARENRCSSSRSVSSAQQWCCAPAYWLHHSLVVSVHYFTVDVEEYFHVSAFESIVSPNDWDRYPSRVSVGVERLLELLARHDARGTFFVLGWLANRRPEIVRAIAAAGHEIASHGWSHQRVTQLCRSRFRTDIRRAKQTLEDVAGAPVLGYRAPSFSITHANDWALDVLVEEGYRYDSSLFPITRSGYGYAGGGTDVHWINLPSGRLLEAPPATLGVGNFRVPAAGGAYFRLFPFAVVRAAFRDYDRRAQRGTFYLHPWELDAHQPRLSVPWWTRIRHYGGITRADTRLQKLLGEFRFAPISSSPELQ